jgi:hypothetical protein
MELADLERVKRDLEERNRTIKSEMERREKKWELRGSELERKVS